MADLSVSIAGIPFQNPVIPASGVFGYGREYEELFSLSKLGGIATKGTTITPRFGNPSPRIAESPSGMLNSVGLQNPGIDAFIERELPNLLTKGTVILANIAGSTIEECVAIAEKLEQTQVHMIELNISCPNVKKGGAAFGVHCESAHAITAAVRAILKNNVGSMSGPAIFPLAVRMVWQVANAVSIPVIGMGGISTGADAIEMMMAGASAVQVGAAIFTDPYAPIHILKEMNQILDTYKIESVKEIVGSVKPW